MNEPSGQSLDPEVRLDQAALKTFLEQQTFGKICFEEEISSALGAATSSHDHLVVGARHTFADSNTAIVPKRYPLTPELVIPSMKKRCAKMYRIRIGMITIIDPAMTCGQNVVNWNE
jgi:hypothetical protein